MDSAFYGRGPVHAALAGGAQVSVTVRADARVKAAIASIAEDAWTMIEYTDIDAVFDETSGVWISRAEVAEIAFTAFAAQPKSDQVPGRLIVRRIPDFQADKHRAARAGRAVRPLAIPCVLHHHRPDNARHCGCRPGPPSARDHRAGPRGLEELRIGAPALRSVHRERRLARARGDRVQPHPRRRHPRRPGGGLAPGPGHHSDRAAHTDSDSVPDRDLGTTTDPAPPAGMALAERLDPTSTNVSQTHPAHPPADHLPTPSARPTPVEHPGSEASHSNTPTHPKPRPSPNQDQLPKPIGGLRFKP